MPKIDAFLVIGILTSISLSTILVLTGLDKAQGLIIGLLGTILTMFIDFFARLRETENRILAANTFDKHLIKDEWLASTVKQIVSDHEQTKKIHNHFFDERAKDAVDECKDVIHGLVEGYMLVEPKGKFTFGPRGIDDAKNSIYAVSYANPNHYWQQTWSENYFQANKRAIARGVKIVRIFLSDMAGLQSLTDVLVAQNSASIEVHVAIVDEIPLELREDFLIQDNIILVKLEITQEGFAKKERISIIPAEIREANSKFERLFRLSISLDEFQKRQPK